MTLEVWSATKQENGHWLFEWTADSGDPFNIYLDGELLDEVTGDSYEAEVDGYDTSPPPLEIVADESGEESESLLNPPYAVLQWRGVSGADAYLVEQLRNGNWVEVKTIMDQSVGYYSFKTETLTDSESSSFRVSAQDVQGNTGTPITFTFYVVRNPAPPEVDLTIDSGDIVVDEA